MKRWSFAAVLCFLLACLCPAFGGYVCFNDCARAVGDATHQYATSWTIHDGSDPAIATGFLKDIATGLDVPVRADFSMGSEGLAVSADSGAHLAPQNEAFSLFDGFVDFSGPIVYYGDYGWHVDVTFSGLNPAKKYTFAGTAIRGSVYPDRQSRFTLTGAASAVNTSSDGVVFKDATTTILLAGDNSTAGHVVRWENIRVVDNGGGTGSFTIRAQASDYTNNLEASSDRGRAYPLNGFMLEEIDLPPTNCPLGDLDGDCIVSVTDVMIFAAAWLQTGLLPANLDGQGMVDAKDFSLLAANWLVNHQTGSLEVILDDPAPVDARWRVDGGPWHAGGERVDGLSVGWHELVFADAPGWNKPAEQSVEIHYNETTTLHAAYIEKTGSVQVIISEPLPAGAQWRIDGGVWRDSGEIVGNLSVGSHGISFSDIVGWDRPADETVEVIEGEMTVITRAYSRQTGALTVTISPPAAIDADAQWRVDGGTWQNSGATVTGLFTGEHTIAFSDVAGWNRPADAMITIQAGLTAAAMGTYTLQTGALTVTITPSAAVDAGAQWRVDGGSWQASGATVQGLLIGSHTVDYKDLAGWAKPGSETVTIYNAQTTAAAGSYTQQTGSVSVTIAEPKPAGAQWRVDGGNWHASGAAVGGLAVGTHLVEFAQVSGWDAPGAETVNVLADQTTVVTTAYLQQVGALTVTVTPGEAVAAGAQWQVDGGAWRNSGDTVSGLAVGSHTVAYSAIAGWTRPANETVDIVKDQTRVIAATYAPVTGSLSVSLEPGEVRSAGARWRVNGGAWQISGATVAGLAEGGHTVEYSAVSGWTSPASETAPITGGQTTLLARTYTQMLGAVTVTISPQDAVDAGAMWRIDAGEWQASETTAGNLSAGWHTVEYLAIADWTKPANETVLVRGGETAAISGTYIQMSWPPLRISEFMAYNANTLDDEDGDASDWIELYNPTGSAVDLDGWYLTDTAANTSRWRFPQVTIDAGGFLVVFASGKDRALPGAELHTNFSLANEGEFLALVAPDGVSVIASYEPRYPQQLADISYGTAQYAMDVISAGATVRYIVPTSAHAGEDWTALAYDDAAWQAGVTSLGFSGGASSGTGIEYEYYQGDWNNLPDFDALTPVKTGKTANFDISVADVADYFGFRFRGHIRITQTNTYTFYTESDDGSRLYIGDTLVVDNDGLHGMREVSGDITLAAGTWPITVTFFEKTGGQGLIVRYSSESLGKQTIPDSVLLGDVATDLSGAMLGVNTSVWCRLAFEVEDPAAFDVLSLGMRYEDGFVAYLNGQEVARRNASAAVTGASWNAAAQTDRPDHEGLAFESISLTEHMGLLHARPARNVLAIHGLNDTVNNGEFMLLPVLIGASNVETPQYFTTPTPGAYNVAGAIGLVDKVSYDFQRGFFDTPFDLTLATETPGAAIYFTLDGSTPSASHGTLYAAPIHIDRTSTVRSVAVKAGYLDSKVKTHTYLFINDVLSQSPAGQAPGPGWPTNSINGQVFNYGMDPDIVTTDSRYNTLVDDALLALPSISLVTDLKHLFDPTTGIYVNAWQDGAAWERPASVELLNPDGAGGFQINAGVRIRGGYSRSGDNPKHAFRLFFRSAYGESKLKYPLFGDEGVNEFDKVDLRTAQNYSWSFGGDGRNTMCREVFSRDTQRDMEQPYTRSRYYHLYINGHYWGIYQTQERAEARFAESYLGGQVEDYDVVKVDAGYVINSTDGNLEAWQRVWQAAVAGLGNDEAYYRLQGMNIDGTDNPEYERLIDIDNLMDYMIITYFVGDFDGPVSNFLGNQSPNNFYGVYNRNARDGFKFFRHDAEHSLFWGWDRTGPWPAGEAWNKFNPQWLHQRLAANPEYRMRFADRVHKHFLNGGLLTPEANISRFSARKDTIDLAIIAESARWGDSKSSSPLNRNDHWLPEVNWIVNSYFPVRTNEVLGQFRNQGWYPNVDAPAYNQNGGHVATDFNAAISNPKGAGTIYYTTDGSDPRLPIRLSTPGGQVTLIAENAPKRVLVPTGDLQGGVGSILAEYWFGIDGTAVSDLTNHPRYAGSPDSSENRTLFEIPVDWADNYGTRMRGYLHPPGTGNYTFWIASDDASQLWLSTTADPANAIRIAQVTGWTSPRQWGKEGGQQSAAIPLAAGQKYYIEALQKEGGGGDNLAVAWQGPGVDTQTVIAGQYLSPAGMAWVKNSYDDSGWTQGSGGVGYERRPSDAINYTSLIGIDVESAMYNQNATCYIRIPFTVSNPDVSALTLRVKYDDGFVAYLNGSEVARRNFTGTPEWNSQAGASHDDSLAVVFEDIDLSPHIGKLRTGSNLLAIQGLNASRTNNDFLISVAMISNEINPGDVSPDAIPYTGPIALTESTRLKARVLNGQWSAMNDFTFAVGPIVENLRITEIMYHPTKADEEFVELTNIGTQAINLNLVRFTNGIRFTFPSTWLSPGDYVIIVRDLAAFQARYGTGINVAGQFEGALDNSGERLTLVDAAGATIHDFAFKDGWYAITDGQGFSLTIRDATAPVSTWGNKNAWRASAAAGGSPGYDDSGLIPAPGAIVINEVLAHSHSVAPDWIELHNTTGAAVNIGGWFLSDNGGDRMKYQIAEGLSIPANGYAVFYEDQHFNNMADPGCRTPFALSENGEAVYLTSGEQGIMTGYTDEEDFGASETNVAFGRYQKSTGTFNFVPMSVNTPGYPNAYPKVGPVVISEIMYNPPGNADAEYIELLNITGSDAVLYDYSTGEPWLFEDDGGIRLSFPLPPVILGAGERLLMVKDPTAFFATFTPAAGTQIFAWGAGSLNNAGEQIQLSKPGDVNALGTRFYIRVDRVVYSDGSHPIGDDPWPAGADGAGDALHRINAAEYGNDVINWQAAPPTPGW